MFNPEIHEKCPTCKGAGQATYAFYPVPRPLEFPPDAIVLPAIRNETRDCPTCERKGYVAK